MAERQGQGIGSDLMPAACIERAERDGIPANLEATSPANRRLYERHGFEATAELALPGRAAALGHVATLIVLGRRGVGPNRAAVALEDDGLQWPTG